MVTTVPTGDVYRQAASVLVLRPSNEGFEILLLHKPRKNDAWQLPQGGVEAGESVEQAAMRELMEEAGISSAQVIGKSEECYKYDFPASFRRFRRDNVCGQCIYYVYATVDPSVKVNVDGKEIDNHLWVAPEKIGSHLKRKEYADLVTRLYNEACSHLPKNA